MASEEMSRPPDSDPETLALCNPNLRCRECGGAVIDRPPIVDTEGTGRPDLVITCCPWCWTANEYADGNPTVVVFLPIGVPLQ